MTRHNNAKKPDDGALRRAALTLREEAQAIRKRTANAQERDPDRDDRGAERAADEYEQVARFLSSLDDTRSEECF